MRLSFASQVVPTGLLSIPVLARVPGRDLAALYPWPAVSLAAGFLSTFIGVFGSTLLLTGRLDSLGRLFLP